VLVEQKLEAVENKREVLWGQHKENEKEVVINMGHV